MTSAIEKVFVSIINSLLVFLLSLPFYLLWGIGSRYSITVVIIFFLCQLLYILSPTRQSVGMRALNIYWDKKYSTQNHLIFALLYTVSFSTLFFWVLFPFDVLLFNLLIVQLPMVLKTGYTLHGYLSGKMAGHKQ
jgi:hypothetical protein